MNSSDNLHVKRSGSGEPLLLLHGLGANTYTWRFLKPDIPDSYEIFEIDLKGFGEAKKPADGKYSIFDQADLVFDLIETLNLPSVSLVGHSMGGGVALATALKVIDGGRQLDRLVLIGSVAYRQDASIPPDMLALIASPEISPERVVRAFLSLGYASPQTTPPPDVVAAYAKPLNMPGGRKALAAAIDQLFPPALDTLSGRYPEITAPALLVWGEQDRLVPLEFGQKLAGPAGLADARIEIIEQCGHIPHEEEPAETVPKIVAFLTQ